MHKKRCRLYILIIVLLLILGVSTYVSNGLNKFITISKSILESDEGNVYISIQHESNPLDLPDTVNTLENFRLIHNALKRNDSFTYYEIYTQSLFNNENQIIAYDDSTWELSTECDGILCAQISENVQFDFKFGTENGRLFIRDDFLIERGKNIPVLLGSEYNGVYEIGVIIPAEYLFSAFNFEVIGFLENNTEITLPMGSVTLDKYIIMPSFEFIDAPSSNQEYVTQKIHYANKTSGILKVNSNEYNQAINSLQELIDKSEVGEYSYYSSSPEKNMLQHGIDVHILYPVCISLTILVSVLTFIVSLKYYKTSTTWRELRAMGMRLISACVISGTVVSGITFFFSIMIGMRWNYHIVLFTTIFCLITLGCAALTQCYRIYCSR